MSTKNKTKLVWRLTKLPTPEELLQLVEAKIITQEEAKEVLFSTETEEDVQVADLQAEIKFLKEVVERLSKNQQPRIIEVIREVEKPWRTKPWFDPYYQWSANDGKVLCTTTNGSGTEQMKSLAAVTFSQL
jgi:hypothetical protein